MNRGEISELVIKTLSEVISYMPELDGAKIDENTPLLAEGSFIDSLTLVSFIVDIEGILIEEHDLNISLTDDKAMSREVSPYQGVAYLVDYINEMVNDH